MIFPGLLSRTMFVVFFSCLFVLSTFAAGSIPRTDLRLELMLATGTLDTSGNGRVVTLSGSSPTYQIDNFYGIPYSKFNGSGGLKINTAWSGTSTDDFTISFWTKIKKAELPVLPSLSTWDGGPGSSYYGNNISISYLTTIFSTQISHDQDALKLTIRNDYKCGLGGIWGNRPYYYYIYDSNNNASTLIDCSLLSDEQWHFVALRRTSQILSISIDDTEVYRNANSMPIPRNINIGQSSLPIDTTARVYNIGNDITSNVLNSLYFKSSLIGFRIYSRSLSATEITQLSGEFDSLKGNINAAGNIGLSVNNYSGSTLYIDMKSIALNLSKNTVVYEYSINTQPFTPINNEKLQDVSNSTGSIAYRFGLDLSSFVDGKLTITLRLKDGINFQNIGSIIYIKKDIIYDISIQQPDSEIASSKMITASVNSGGILSMLLIRNNICDSTVSGFENYSELIFTNKNDNGLKVCYKAFFPSLNITIYKASGYIAGIAPATIQSTKLFEDYTTWIKSLYQKPNDTASMMLDLLAVSPGSTQGTINGVTMTDINGDGLVDFLYSNNATIDVIAGIKNNYKAIIVNNGNYTFKSAYKCVNVISNNINTYYGDCADITR